MTAATIQTFLLNLTELAGLSAAGATVTALVEVLPKIDTTTLPANVQNFAIVLIPVLVSGLTIVGTNIATEITAKQAAITL